MGRAAAWNADREGVVAEKSSVDQLEEALRHAQAGLKALQAAHQTAASSGQIYATHIYLGTVELAHAIEVAMKVALRNQ
jgi:hypothetical protein